MSDTPIPPNGDDAGDINDDPSLSVQPVALQDEMERSFLDYAMSVIMARALPDVRDGLKPVHRRIIWDMDEQGFRPDRPFVKSARVTGDTMARYHPHGDCRDLRRAGAHGPAVLAAPSADRLPRQLWLARFRTGWPRYCVTGDTRVRLADGSSVAIADLVDFPDDSERDVDFSVVDRDGKPVRAAEAFNSGLHPTKRITTSAGFSLRGSHNHPVLCLVPVAGVPMFQWLQLDEIAPGTVVCIARNTWMMWSRPRGNPCSVSSVVPGSAKVGHLRHAQDSTTRINRSSTML